MSIVLEVMTNVRCRVTGLDKKSITTIDEALAMDIPGAFFSPRMKGGGWDGKRHMFGKETGTFPKGLQSKVEQLLVELKLKYKVTDLRKKVLPPPDASKIAPGMLKGITLRDYQVDAVKAAVTVGNGILWLATNAGKTEVAAAVIKVYERKTLFLVGKKGLLSQARDRIALRLGTIPEHIGIIGDGRCELEKPITVAIINSVSRKGKNYEAIKKYLKTVEVLFIDEGHHAKATTWYKIINLCTAQFRFILSGTPFGSGNGLMVEATVGPVIARVSNDTLVSLGVSAKPTIEILEVNEPEIEKQPFMTWDVVYKEGITRNTYRNNLVATKAAQFAAEGKPCLILVKELWHGDLIATMLKSRKVKHEFVHGQMPISMVEAAKQRFEARKNPVLIASPIFDEGVDVPAIKALIIADGGKSIRSVLQKIGRGLRQKAGENTLSVVDFADLTHKWLAKHSMERIAIYEDENFQVVEGVLPE